MLRQVPKHNKYQWERMIDAFVHERSVLLEGARAFAHIIGQTGNAQSTFDSLLERIWPMGDAAQKRAEQMLEKREEVFDEQMQKVITITDADARLDLSSLLD